MEKLVVLGGGESGVGTAILGKKNGFDVFLSDFGTIKPEYIAELEAHAIPFEMNQHSVDRVLTADKVVKSPGIPEKAAIIQQIRAAGIPIESEIEFAATFTSVPIIAITGSNGKTTTTSLIAHLLKQQGLHIGLGGNIGTSFARMCQESVDYFVLEISSFQLDDCYEFKPHIAILLNITPDHLERYDNFQAYSKAKGKIFQKLTATDYLIHNESDPETRRILTMQRTKAKCLPIEMDDALVSSLTLQNQTYYLNSCCLKGVHNQFNIRCAITVASLLNISPTTIQKGLDTFEAIPHRLEPVRTYKGVRFINDSKATNVEATKFALQSLEDPIIWIVGGVDKGNNYDEIKMLVNKSVQACVFLGKNNQKLISAFGHLPYQEASSMDMALSKAMQFAQVGSVVLLSPACASFDLFQNYIDRGDQFRSIIQAWDA